MAKQCTMRVVTCSGRTVSDAIARPRSVERREAAGGMDQVDFVKGEKGVGLGGEPAPMAARLPPHGFHLEGFGHLSASPPRRTNGPRASYSKESGAAPGKLA